MRNGLSVLALLIASLVVAQAQVAVEVLLDQEQFLRDESLPVKVRVLNRSGQTLNLGSDPEWLTFTIETHDGKPVRQSIEPPLKGEFTLDSAMAGTRSVDLLPYFDISEPGRYKITATLRITNWNFRVDSPAKPFEIVRGTKLWEHEFGIPNIDSPPTLRKYTLQQANYLKRLMLYVRITDPSEREVYRVMQAGPLLSFSRPEAQVDRISRLHLLFQIGARTFRYLVITPIGTVALRQTYEYSDTRPVLRAQPSGNLLVEGGFRRFQADDVPPPVESPKATNVTDKPNP